MAIIEEFNMVDGTKINNVYKKPLQNNNLIRALAISDPMCKDCTVLINTYIQTFLCLFF